MSKKQIPLHVNLVDYTILSYGERADNSPPLDPGRASPGGDGLSFSFVNTERASRARRSRTVARIVTMICLGILVVYQRFLLQEASRENEVLQQTTRASQRLLVVKEQHLDELFDDFVQNRTSTAEFTDSGAPTMQIWRRFDEDSLLIFPSQFRMAHVSALRRLAWMFLQIRQPDIVIAHLGKAVSYLTSMDSEDPGAGYDYELAQVYMHLARLHASNQDTELAVTALHDAARTLKASRQPKPLLDMLRHQIEQGLDALTAE